MSQSIRNFPSFSEILTQQILVLMLAKLQFKHYITFLHLVHFDIIKDPYLLEEILDFPELVPQFSVTVVSAGNRYCTAIIFGDWFQMLSHTTCSFIRGLFGK